MEKFKQINIKNRSYYFCDDMINIKNFHSNLLTIDKKSRKIFNIYNIGYITIKKFKDCENINSENLLYLIINDACGYFKEKYNEKYLIIDLIDIYEEVSFRIRSEIQTLNGGKELYHKKNYAKIVINTDNDLPLNKPLKFPKLTIIIKCILREGEKLHPQIYLDECLHEL